ncbi:hypothetical protein [Cellulomonas rhizosphaerae]|uniref:Uncharacterized protein n=1 Tax=Cellulomonas rhizosphaerae TaxID=2293719 RepID=A0A413RPP3_9CELL|nr:hypothetical protein [Cellulomonas rhizosphaerae]RHA43913.1 hypothetical protein D1825_03895 [Cellulomonas rhizosphaerae]
MATVVGLGAWCDESDVPEADGLAFDVDEFAMTSDAERITILDRRGFALALTGGRSVAENRTALTAEGLTASVLTTVLPDDAEETGDEHRWAELAADLVGRGFDVTGASLRALPYQVVLSERIRTRLGR